MLILALHVSTLFAQDSKDLVDEVYRGPISIHVYTELIEVSSIEYAKLMTQPLTGVNHTDLRNKLLERVKQGEAKLISNQSLLSRSGERVYSKSALEYIYPTEYSPPGSLSKPWLTKDLKRNNNSALLSIYTDLFAFETRDVGTLIEFEATVDQGREGIRLYFNGETVKHADDHTYRIWDIVTEKFYDKIPTFYSIKSNASIVLKNNEFSLVNSHSPELAGKTDETRRWLYFLKASILEVTK